jgi:hypothetical protein
MKRRTYGIDSYSRYVEIDGEHYQVEPWPFRGLNFWTIRARIEARWGVACWHVGIIRQHGLRGWNYLRKF